jgi:type II secretory pathway component PulJ
MTMVRLSPRSPTALRCAAFTIIEVMISVLILLLISVSLYRFLSVNLGAIAASTEGTIEQEQLNALFRYLQAEFDEIPAKGQGRFSGNSKRFADLSDDEMQWTCKPGPGVLTTAAEGTYKTTLMRHPRSATSRNFDLGLRRRSSEATGNEWSEKDWWPLVRDVAELEIRYWDARMNQRVERWQDPNVLPLMVTVSLRKSKNSPLRTVVLTIPSARLQGP